MSTISSKTEVAKQTRSSASGSGAPKKAKSLREKVLGKTTQALSVLRSGPSPIKKAPETSSTSTLVIVNTPESLLKERMQGVPSKIPDDSLGAHTEDQGSVVDSEATDEFDSSSIGSVSSARRRVSMLYTTRKGTGVEMDAATKAANDLLLKGKDALEAAGNMKRECKAVAHESLQGLYEIVLSVADSRSRHLNNLERERTRHAQEIVRIERAHSKELLAMKKNLVEEMGLARADITGTLEEAKAIRSWLGYEMEEPFRNIKATKDRVTTLGTTLREELEGLMKGSSTATNGDPEWETMEANLTSLNTKATSISNQIDSLRRSLEEVKSAIAAPPTPPALPSPGMFPDDSNEKLDQAIKQLHDMTQTLTTKIDMVANNLSSPPPPTPIPAVELTHHL